MGEGLQPADRQVVVPPPTGIFILVVLTCPAEGNSFLAESNVSLVLNAGRWRHDIRKREFRKAWNWRVPIVKHWAGSRVRPQKRWCGRCGGCSARRQLAESSRGANTGPGAEDRVCRARPRDSEDGARDEVRRAVSASVVSAKAAAGVKPDTITCNAVLNAGLHTTARSTSLPSMLEEFIEQGHFEELDLSSSRLDLHDLSAGAAYATVILWLMHLEGVQHGEGALTLITGWHLSSWG